MQRVTIIGQPGSGKSTLARRLGERTYLPVHHMDQVHWRSGWVERPQTEKTAMVEEIVARGAWIFEGNNSATMPVRLARSDTLIWLDLPLALRVGRVILRTVRHYGRARPDSAPGCPERFDPEFFGYIWRTRRTGRAKLRAIFDGAPDHVTRIHLASTSAVRAYLAGLEDALALGNLGIPHR